MGNIKAKILRYCEMAWPSLVQLKQWMRRSATFNTFDPDNFGATSLRIAEATNERGETVCFCPVETVLMVSAYAVSPTATPSEAHAAGDCVDAEIAKLGQRSGISKMLIVLPDHMSLPGDDWKKLSVYERKIPLTAPSGGIGLPVTSQATHYLN